MFIHPGTALVLSCVVIVLGETGGRDREIERLRERDIALGTVPIDRKTER